MFKPLYNKNKCPSCKHYFDPKKGFTKGCGAKFPGVRRFKKSNATGNCSFYVTIEEVKQ